MKKRIPLGGIVSIALGLSAGLLAGCASLPKSNGTITSAHFGNMPDGTSIEIYTLRNNQGMEARIITYGGVVQSLTVPDKTGNMTDIVLGYDKLDGYVANSPFFGALIGRFGNRIGKAHFTLDGVTYALAANNGPNTLHGGVKGFDKVVWQAHPLDNAPDGPALELTYTSKDGEEGFPGTLKVRAVYTVTKDNALRVDFTATTDKDTVVNLTHHSYFNFAGKGDILGHVVYINADKYTPVDSTLIPKGEPQSVAGTPFDFRTPTAIGARITQGNEQLKFGTGYDHNWVISKPMGKLGLQARVTETTTGRVMEVWSTEPGLQFYTGNFLNDTYKGKGGRVYQFRNAFTMEPQHYPDSPNRPDFPTTELKPGETYSNTIIYKFSTQ